MTLILLASSWDNAVFAESCVSNFLASNGVAPGTDLAKLSV